jgi:hypothetical protein
MARAFDPTDVLQVAADEMMTALSAVVESGRVMVLFEGAEKIDREQVEAAFWEVFEGETARGGMVLLRLWSLVDALQSRRLNRLLLARGFDFLEAAFSVAAELRLNVDWGFAPQRLIWAIDEAERQPAVQPESPVVFDELEPLLLAA